MNELFNVRQEELFTIYCNYIEFFKPKLNMGLVCYKTNFYYKKLSLISLIRISLGISLKILSISI